MYVTAKSWGQKNTATRAPGLEASIVPVVAPFNIGGTPGGASERSLSDRRETASSQSGMHVAKILREIGLASCLGERGLGGVPQIRRK